MASNGLRKQTSVLAMIVLLIIGSLMLVNGADLNKTNQQVDAWGPVSQGLRLSAQSQEGVVRSEGPIVLKLVFRNVTNRVLILKETNQDYMLDVKSEAGARVQLTKKGEEIFQPRRRHEEIQTRFTKIKPAQEVHRSIDITGLYEMAAGHTYFITVKRNIYRLDRKATAEVVSNTVKISVVR